MAGPELVASSRDREKLFIQSAMPRDVGDRPVEPRLEAGGCACVPPLPVAGVRRRGLRGIDRSRGARRRASR